MTAEDRFAVNEPVVVHVDETINPALAEHEGVVYESPPLPRTEALILVRLLIGRECQPIDQDCWRCPIAGGQRWVRLEAPERADERKPTGNMRMEPYHEREGCT